MSRLLKLVTLVLILGAVALSVRVAKAAPEVQIQAGGATFPDPIYQQWIKDFVARHGDVKVAYAAKGSGAGISGLIDKTFDFAGSDAPMDDKEIARAKAAGGDIVEIPSVAGAVVLAYNVPGIKDDLKLSGPVIADIYLGKITKWNDKAIKSLNPDLNLPGATITAVHRSEGSGTNYVVTSYLSTQSDEFQTKIGFGKTVDWHGGAGGQGNPGVTQAVQHTEGAIGYIELNFAVQNHISYALVQNNSGKFVKASAETVSLAGEGAVKNMDEEKTLAVRLWSRDGDNVYPISSFTYLICYKDLGYLKDKAKAQGIVDFFWYATHNGQAKAPEMTYAPLSKGVADRVEKALDSITFNGSPLPASK